jgi:hypothetical protein
LIACLQRQVPSYAGYFNTRSPQPSSFSESAKEPGSWGRADVKTLWRKNLYGEEYDGPSLTVSVSGSQYLDEGELGTWTASPSNGTGSYSYSWEVRKNPGLRGSTCAVILPRVVGAQDKFLRHWTRRSRLLFRAARKAPPRATRLSSITTMEIPVVINITTNRICK